MKRLITVTGLGAGVQRPRHSVIPLKADIHQRGLHVRLVPSADMGHSLPVCLPSSPVRQRVMRHQTLKPSAAQDNGHFSISHPAQPRPLTAYRHLIKFAEQATKPQGFSNSAPC